MLRHSFATPVSSLVKHFMSIAGDRDTVMQAPGVTVTQGDIKRSSSTAKLQKTNGAERRRQERGASGSTRAEKKSEVEEGRRRHATETPRPPSYVLS